MSNRRLTPIAQTNILVATLFCLSGSVAYPDDTIHVSIDAEQTIRIVDSRVLGLNSATWDGALNTKTTINRLKEAGIRVLRFPGGSTSDLYHWKTNTHGSPGQLSSFDAFANVITATRTQAFITVNYGTGTSSEAGEWVRYANKTKDLGIKYWEIGNENYGSWEADTQAYPHDPILYANRARQYISRMKTEDPTIKVGVVIAPSEDSYPSNRMGPATNPRTGQAHYGWTALMLSRLKTLNVVPDFVIYHHYPYGPYMENDAGLLQNNFLTDWGRYLSQMVIDYLGVPKGRVELVLTEINNVWSDPGKQSTSLVNGLYLADSVGAVLESEFSAFLWWTLRNGQLPINNNSSALYGWRNYGDYGVLPSNYGGYPLQNANQPYPSYFALKLLSKFATEGSMVVEASSSSPLLSVFVIKQITGALSMLVINKSPTETLNAQIALSGFTPKSEAHQYSYGIQQDNAVRTGIGSPDLEVTTFGDADTTFLHSFSPYSVTVIALLPAAASMQIIPVEDAEVRAGAAAGTNFGNAAKIAARRVRKPTSVNAHACAYLKLNLANLNAIPRSARLNLTLSGASPVSSNLRVKIYRIPTTAWRSSKITWNNAPGLKRTNYSSTGTLVSSTVVPLGISVASFEVTGLVTENIGKMVTLQIVANDANGNSFQFKSRESPSGKPTLLIDVLNN